MLKMLFLICYLSVLTISATDELRDAGIDFCKGAKEFVAEIESIIANEEYLKKIEIDKRFESKVEDIGVLERANRKLSIKLFEEYINKYPDSKNTADILYKLGKLYFEESSERIIKETESYEKEHQKFLRGEIPVLPPEPDINYSLAITSLSKLINNYKDYHLKDNALYLLGCSYLEEGQTKKAVSVFDRLVEEFPKSEKAPEVYTRLGEYYFDMEDFDKSVYYYSQALEYPDSGYYDNVLYKLAWTYYRVRRITEAATFFVTLIDYYEKKFGHDYQNPIKREAKNYITVGFTEFKNGAQDAYTFFRKIGGRRYEYEIMHRICHLYKVSDRHKEARRDIRFVIKHYPDNPDNPILQDKLIDTYKYHKNVKPVIRERERLFKLFGEGSRWREKNKSNIKAIIVADELIAQHLVAIALYYHNLGDKRRSRREYIKAAKLYYAFLKKYPLSTVVLGARYNYAQVLFNLGDWRGAIQEYSAVQSYKGVNKYREGSSFGIILSWQNKLKAEDPKYASEELKPSLDKRGKLLPAKELNLEEESTVAACKKYEELNPKGKRLPLVWYTEAEVYFRNSRFDSARNRYEAIVSKYPNEKISISAARNIIATYNYEGNYAKVEEWSKKLVASGVKDIKSLLTGSVFKSAQQMEKTGRFEDAAKEYIRLADEFPESRYSDAALYNAGLIYEKTGKPFEAMKTYKALIRRYPKSKHSPSAMFKIAVNCEQQLEFDKALSYYGGLIKKYPRSKVVVDAHYNSARLRRANNQFAHAAYHLVRYGKNQSLMQAAKLYERAGDSTKALKTYARYISKNPKDLDGVIGSYVRRGRIYENIKRRRRASREYRKAIATFKASGSPKETLASHYIAEAKFRLVYDLMTKYDAIKIRRYSRKKYKRAVKRKYERKEKLLQRIANDYLNVVKLGSPQWSVASLYMVGYAFHQFAKFLYDAPIPRELKTEKLKDEYHSQIKSQAAPYENKAAEYYEKCIFESARLKAVNVWTKKVNHQLVLLKPGQYFEEKKGISLVSPSLEIKDYGYIGR